jgi:hypothetical protein
MVNAPHYPVKRSYAVWLGNSGVTDNPVGIEVNFKSLNIDPKIYNLMLQSGFKVTFSAKRLADSAFGVMGELNKSSLDGDILVNPQTGDITVPISVAESRQFQMGRVATYEIKMHGAQGGSLTILYGNLTPAGVADNESDSLTNSSLNFSLSANSGQSFMGWM